MTYEFLRIIRGATRNGLHISYSLVSEVFAVLMTKNLTYAIFGPPTCPSSFRLEQLLVFCPFRKFVKKFCLL